MAKQHIVPHPLEQVRVVAGPQRRLHDHVEHPQSRVEGPTPEEGAGRRRLALTLVGIVPPVFFSFCSLFPTLSPRCLFNVGTKEKISLHADSLFREVLLETATGGVMATNLEKKLARSGKLGHGVALTETKSRPWWAGHHPYRTCCGPAAAGTSPAPSAWGRSLERTPPATCRRRRWGPPRGGPNAAKRPSGRERQSNPNPTTF